MAGGVGHRVADRKLHVDEKEAAVARLLFLELGSMRALQREQRRRDIRSRVRKLATGRTIGGVHLTNGPLAHLLRNYHYLGEINHRDQSYPGEHAAFIDAETFAKVQAKLDGQRVARAARLKSNALLIGKLFNETNERLTPSYAVMQSVRYRYYISTSAKQERDRDDSATHRLPAPALEAAVVDALRSAIEKQASRPGVKEALFEVAADRHNDAGTIDGCASQEPTSSLSSVERNRSLIDARLVRIVVRSDRLEIEYRHDLSDPHAAETLSVPWTKAVSKAPRAIPMPHLPHGQGRRMEAEERDRLIFAIASARSWLDGLVKGTISNLAELAAGHKRTERSIRMTLSLAFLDPALIHAACAGGLPRGYGVTRLTGGLLSSNIATYRHARRHPRLRKLCA